MLTVLAFAAILSASPAYATPDLVAYWRLDDGTGTTAVDSSGFGNHGALLGAATWTEGKFGGGVTFDGSTGKILVAASPWLEPPTVTVGAWVSHVGPQGAFKYIVAKGAQRCNAAAYGLYTGFNGGLQFYVSTRAGKLFTRSPESDLTVWDGQWHYVAGSFDGRRVRLYLDGAQVGTGTATIRKIDYATGTSTDLYLGSYPGCADHDFAGGVDDVRIWRSALTADEIVAAMTPLPEDPAPPPPPVSRCTVPGTDGKDVLVGTPGRDVICGFGGADVIRGFGGKDLLLGGSGNDRIYGGRGADKAKGGGGRDTLVGGRGRDTLIGGRARDVFKSRDGVRDVVKGGGGRDRGRLDRALDRRISVEVLLR